MYIQVGEDRPLFTSPHTSSYLTAAAWSPTRPAVLIVACGDGSLLVWDFTDSSYRPSIELKATHTKITSLEFLSSNISRQQLLAVGDESGTLHIFEIPRNITRQVPREEVIMGNFIDRELRVSQMHKNVYIYIRITLSHDNIFMCIWTTCNICNIRYMLVTA